MTINVILFILFIALCGLTFAVIKLYSELTFLKEYNAVQEEYNVKLFKLIVKEIKELKGEE